MILQLDKKDKCLYYGDKISTGIYVMNIEDYIGVCQKERQGKSFAFPDSARRERARASARFPLTKKQERF